MNSLEIAPQELRQLLQQASALAADYWESLPERPVYPKTSALQLEKLFSAELPESGLGAAAFNGFTELAANSRAGNGRFFGLVCNVESRFLMWVLAVSKILFLCQRDRKRLG